MTSTVSAKTAKAKPTTRRKKQSLETYNESATASAPGSASSRPDSGLAESESDFSEEERMTTKTKSVHSQSKTSTSKSSKHHKDEMVKVDIDLTNPDDLLNKMESLNLTEEETEDLLKQAYKINRQLKHELSESDRIYTVSAPAKRLFSSSSKGQRRLPPISKNSKQYTSDAFSTSQHSGRRSGIKKSAKARPEWVD